MSVLPWITGSTWLIVVLPGQIEGNTMQGGFGDRGDTSHSQEQSLGGPADAELLMQKLSTIQENTDRFALDSLESGVLVGKKKTEKHRKIFGSHNTRSRSHHHHELSDRDKNSKNSNISKDARLYQPTLQNSSVLRDFLMQKIKVFSRVKLGSNKEIEPKESWTGFYRSTTISNREIDEASRKSASHRNNARNLKLKSNMTAEKLGDRLLSQQVWQHHKRASNQNQFQSLDQTSKSSLNQRKQILTNSKGETHSAGKHRTNFGLGGKVPEIYKDANQRFFPLNIKETEERSLDIQVDDLSINKSSDNATKDLKVGSSHLSTEYLDEYDDDDPTGPYISNKLISHTKALNSKTIFIDDSLNEQTENISKTELIDSRAGKTSISISSIVGIGFGALVFFLILSVLSATLLYKKQYLRKAESMDKSFVSCDSYSGSCADSETFNSISYADCAGIEIAKDNSSEELYNLDNDSFLNSLEAISFPEYWTDKL